MPSLGADMEAGTLVAWIVKPGDRVHRGDIIAEVETDKATVEVEVYEDGIVEEFLVTPGTKVPVGTPLATLTSAGDAATATSGAASTATPAVPIETRSPAMAVTGHIRASPLARRIAAERGIDLSVVKGTGPGGVIERGDVEAAAMATPAPMSAPEATTTTDAQERMRRAIVAAMSKSHREIPCYRLQHGIDLQRAMNWLERHNASVDLAHRLLPAALLLKAVALALVKVPALNGYWIDELHRPQESINVGVAISLRHAGLIAPAIPNADRLTLQQLMAAMSDLIVRTRAGRLRSSEMASATITVTNIGDTGVEVVHGLIYPPQIALVGFGRIVERPCAVDGLLGVRPIVQATLAADHRATDGHTGARFLEALSSILQNPEEL